MRAAYADPIVTRYTLDDLAYALRTGLTSVLGSRPRDEVVAVAMSKTRLEGGNGEHIWNNNIGNVKCPEEAPGNFTCILLNEVEKKLGDPAARLYWYDPRGELVGGKGSALKYAPLDVPDGHPQTRMYSRANTTDGGYFYIDFIFNNKRYAKAGQALLAGNPEAYSRELHAAGYYTAPVEQYTATVLKLYGPSLAFLRGQHAEQPVVPERNEWYNQLLIDGYVDAAYQQLHDEGPHGARDALDDEA